MGNSRVLKFRAWDKSEKKMFPISEIHFSFVDGIYDFTSVTIFDKERGEATRHKKDVEIMEYTGLKEKSGKEIYEGDIVQIKDDQHCRDDGSCFQRVNTFVVEKGEYQCCNGGEYGNNFGLFLKKITEDVLASDEKGLITRSITKCDGDHHNILDCRRGEVIDNIYQNSDLIK